MSKPKALFRVGMRPVTWSELDAQRRLSVSKKNFEDSVWDGAFGLWKPAGEDVRYCRTAGSDGTSTSTLSFDYVFERGHDSVFFAYYVPYTYSMLQWTLNHLVRDPATRAFCRLKRLAMTVGESCCDMLTITNSRIERKMKKVVIVSARVHPGESNASWLVHGLMGFLLSSTAEAQVLRDNFVWICVPMLNPDGVICGNYRCGLCGTDLNRQWKQPNQVLHSSVHKLKKLVARSKAKLCMYLDLHGHSRKCGILAYACGQFAENDHRRFTVRIFPKLLSMLTPEFNFFHCRWSVCEKRKPKYTSCALKSTLPYRTLRETQTPTVVATPQLLSSLPCQIKGTCSTPTPKCTSELLLFSPDATVTRNRSTRTKDGTQPRNTRQQGPKTKGWQLFHLP